MPSSPPVRFVAGHHLRTRFNLGRYADRIAQGEFTAVPARRDRHLTKATRSMPPCTLSQVVAYSNHQGQLVAVVHQYRLADGSLGASGKPDPKYLFEDGVIYKVALPEP
ncbi:MAG: hypothetical protein AB1806_10030 [Acidobacteriota bacterium]